MDHIRITYGSDTDNSQVRKRGTEEKQGINSSQELKSMKSYQNKIIITNKKQRRQCGKRDDSGNVPVTNFPMLQVMD